MRATDHKRWEATAYHEAGHAVAAYVVGRRVREISIVADGDMLGHVAYWPWPDSFHPDYETDGKTRRMVESGIITSLAGPVAEALFRGRHNWRGANSDTRQAVDLASYMCGGAEETGAYIGWLFWRARTILSLPEHWAAVQALAGDLLEQRRIGTQRARQIIKMAIYGREG